MIVRPARPEDAEAAALVLRRSIAELCRADHQDDPETLRQWLGNKTPESVRAWIAAYGPRLVVAEAEGRILGIAGLQPSGRISVNYVSPDARFMGVSKGMMADLERQARGLGLTECTLESTRTALAFYRGIGYTEAGPPVPGFGVTQAHPMRKRLGDAA
ncbi:MAG: GNAT family N-acetyltransferase [Hyphomicrobiales bacterium]|nr:MAG: GNAT family N-acetyltransferase [Hyphomicrobiales bacterium]